MEEERVAEARTLGRAVSGVLLAMVVAVGVVALLFFVRQLLQPGELTLLSLPLVAVLAGLAATFNPCGLPVLPGFLAFLGGGERQPAPSSRLGLSLAAALGAISLVLVIGIVVAIAGEGTKGVIAPHFRWVQLAVGLALIGMAGVHLLGQSSRLPLVAQVTGLGSQLWERTVGHPTPRGSYLFGAGFVLVGAGWTGPFLAAVAVFAIGLGGFLTGLWAFAIFGVTMGLAVFLLAFLGSSSGPALTRSLRVWGRRVQVAAAAVIALIGAALLYASANPGIYDRLLLS